MSEAEAPTKPWRLINLKVPHATLERIDAEVDRLNTTRTKYMIERSDPKRKRRA